MLRRNEPQFIVHPLHTMNRYFNTNTFVTVSLTGICFRMAHGHFVRLKPKKL